MRTVHAHPGRVTVLALAPLTNIAQALMLDPQLGDKWVRGGAVRGAAVDERGRGLGLWLAGFLRAASRGQVPSTPVRICTALHLHLTPVPPESTQHDASHA